MRDDEDPLLRRRASAMRKEPTEPERRLWWALRHRLPVPGSHFRRQVVIGRAIVDFACVAKRLVVEVDGDQHGRNRAAAHDEERSRRLEAAGWRVMRFSNAEVMTEIDVVLDTIFAALEWRTLSHDVPTPGPSP